MSDVGKLVDCGLERINDTLEQHSKVAANHFRFQWSRFIDSRANMHTTLSEYVTAMATASLESCTCQILAPFGDNTSDLSASERKRLQTIQARWLEYVQQGAPMCVSLRMLEQIDSELALFVENRRDSFTLEVAKMCNALPTENQVITVSVESSPVPGSTPLWFMWRAAKCPECQGGSYGLRSKDCVYCQGRESVQQRLFAIEKSLVSNTQPWLPRMLVAQHQLLQNQPSVPTRKARVTRRV